MQCLECGAEKMARGAKIVHIPTDDGDSVNLRINVWFCNKCEHFEADVELL